MRPRTALGVVVVLACAGGVFAQTAELYRWSFDTTGNPEGWNRRPWGATAPSGYVFQANSYTWTITPPNCIDGVGDCAQTVFVNLMGRTPAEWPWDGTHPTSGGALAIMSSDDVGLYVAGGVKLGLALPADEDVTAIELNLTTAGQGGTRWVDFYLQGEQPGTSVRLRATNLDGWGNSYWSPWKWRRTTYDVSAFRGMQYIAGSGFPAEKIQNLQNLNKLYAVNIVGGIGVSPGNPLYLDDVRLLGTYKGAECGNRPAFADSSPVVPAEGSMAEDLTVLVKGINLDQVSAVKLQQPDTGASVVGVISGQSATQLSVLFPLYASASRPGRYDVALEKPGCTIPPLTNGFLVTPDGGNLLRNSSLEDDADADAWPDYWERTGAAEWPTSGWFNNAGPHTGQREVGAASNGGVSEGTIEQSVGLPYGPGHYDLALSFWAWLWDNSAAYASAVRGEIVVDGQTVATAEVGDAGQDRYNYTNFIATFGGEATQEIRVRLTVLGDGRGGDGWGVVVADDVQLITLYEGCNDPLADADGDGDVDMGDFGMMQLCYSGGTEPMPTSPAYCRCLDFQSMNGWDGHIDQADIVAFIACQSGPGVAANPCCDGGMGCP